MSKTHIMKDEKFTYCSQIGRGPHATVYAVKNADVSEPMLERSITCQRCARSYNRDKRQTKAERSKPRLWQSLIGKTITQVHDRPFDDGRGGQAYDPLIVFDDGTYLTLDVQETETEYGVTLQFHRFNKGLPV